MLMRSGSSSLFLQDLQNVPRVAAGREVLLSDKLLSKYSLLLGPSPPQKISRLFLCLLFMLL